MRRTFKVRRIYITMGKLDQHDFQKRIGKIEALIRAMDEIANPTTRANAKALVQALLDLHGMGLERMLDTVYESGPTGQTIIDDLGRDELVGNLLLLHGLHPLDLETRVLQALDKVKPYMRSHGGNVELLGITEEGVVKLRLEGSCHSCPSSRVTLKYAVEEAIYKVAPDVTAVEAEGAVESQFARTDGFIPMSELLGGASPFAASAPLILRQAQEEYGSRSDGWVKVDGLSLLKEGSLRTMEVSGLPVLFCHVGDAFYAYGNTCPNCSQLLGQAKLAGPNLTCATCGHSYDIMRAGRNLAEPRLHLEPFPLLEENGQVKVALPSLQP